MEDLETLYVSGQGRDDFPQLLKLFQEASDREAARADGVLDVSYGPQPRQSLDFFPAAGKARGTLIYYHAGYWQSRDKAQFRFIAGPFNRTGLNVAVVNYPLCPDVTVRELVNMAAGAPQAVARLAPDAPIILAGHSAGGQIIVELAMLDLGSIPRLAGIVAISGVFDLRPLVTTSLNKNLRLDVTEAAKMSPVLRAQKAAPGIFAVGGEETSAFLAQNATMTVAWQDAGNIAQPLVVKGSHHFSILADWVDPRSTFNGATMALVSAAA